jgi:hypothetical protein
MTSGAVVTSTPLSPLRLESTLRSETAPQAVSSGRQSSFGQVLDRISSKSNLSTREDFRSLASFEKATDVGHEFSMKELLSFQVKTARLHLRLEACAKIADAAVSSIKRFQSMR